MDNNPTLQNQLCQKLRMVGLPKEIVLPLVNQLTRQLACEGSENVVKRLKILKQAAINHVAGQPASFTWIAHTKSGVPKGAWKPVWKMLASTQYKHRKRAFNALMVYASIVLPRKAAPTAAQERKFLGSVVQDVSVVTQRSSATARFISRNGSRLCNLMWPYATPRFMGREAQLEAAPNVVEYALRKWGPTKTGVTRLDKHVTNFFYQSGFKPFLRSHFVREAIGDLGSQWYGLLAGTSSFLTDEWNLPAGTRFSATDIKVGFPIGVIGSSQEPGMKFRAFASPNIVLQAALEPLKDQLFRVLRRCPWDCTYDQEKGVRWVQEQLQSGKTCYSVDLSDATNNFPLDVQMRLLRDLGHDPEALDLFEGVSRASYLLTWDKTRVVEWNVGQPLGAGPSFAAFAIAHAAVARLAELRGDPRAKPGSTFRILGDDFITNSEGTNHYYRMMLDELGCPVSESKCLSSNMAGEFAGKLITSAHVYHGFKYKALTDASFMSMLRSLGASAVSRSFLNKDQLAYAKALRDVPSPMGLGFNPKGVPLSQRYEMYLHMKEYLDRGNPPKDAVTKQDELLNVFYHLTSLKWARWGEAERDYPGVRKDNMASPKTVTPFVPETHLERLRNARLLASRVDGGDPRVPEIRQSLAKSTSARTYAEIRMGLVSVPPEATLIGDAAVGSVSRDTNLGETMAEMPSAPKKPVRVSKGPTFTM